MPQRYVVPQFLTVEPKIIGPITMRQFLWSLGTVLTLLITFRLLTLPFFIGFGIFQVAIGASFAFLKVNGLPFHYFLINFLQTMKRPRVRVWSKEYSDIELKQFMNQKHTEVAAVHVRRVRPSASHLAKLSLVVNTGGAYNPDDESVLRPYGYEKSVKS